MFTRFISLLVLVAPFVSALTIDTPTSVTSGGTVNINWTTDASDSFTTFSLELVNPALFNNAIAISNNVVPSAGSITLELPIVQPGPGYTIEAVNIGNINQVFAQTGSFSIGATITSSVSASTVGSATGTNTNSLPSTANSLPVTSSTSVSGVSSSTGTGTTGTGTGTTGTGTTGTGTAASTTSSAAAVSSRLALTNAGGYAVLLLSAVAGAAVVAL